MNLVIGNSSQLSHYFPEDYVKISSRNVDLSSFKNIDAAYLTFAEQRIYDSNIDYITPNYIYTLNLIEQLLNKCNKIVCYTTCDLWSNCRGAVNLNTPFHFNLENEYCLSKLLLVNKIKQRRALDPIYNNVCIMHPFYFNSIYRNNYFLFGKIFESLKYRKTLKVDSLDINRDMVHAKFMVSSSVQAKSDVIVGSGHLVNLREFIKDIFNTFNLNYEDYIIENNTGKYKSRNEIFAATDNTYSYQQLLNDTCEEIEKAQWIQ